MNAFSLRNPIALGFGLLIAVIVMAATLAIVPETRTAVVYRFGQYNGVVNPWRPGEAYGSSGAGLIARIPFVDRLVWVDKRVQDVALDNTQVLSTDQLRLNVDAYARFRVVDPLRMINTAGSEARVADQLRPLLGTAIRNELGKRRFAVLLSPERTQLMDNIQTALDREARKYGTRIVDVRIKHADLPEGGPLDSALARMRTARQQEANSIAAEGLKNAQIVRADADAAAARIYADAFSKDADFYDFYRAMQSYRATFGADGGPAPEGGTSLIMGPNNAYLREFEGRGR